MSDPLLALVDEAFPCDCLEAVTGTGQVGHLDRCPAPHHPAALRVAQAARKAAIEEAAILVCAYCAKGVPIRVIRAVFHLTNEGLYLCRARRIRALLAAPPPAKEAT